MQHAADGESGRAVYSNASLWRLVGDPVMRDNTGNWLVLVEPREFTAEDSSSSYGLPDPA